MHLSTPSDPAALALDRVVETLLGAAVTLALLAALRRRRRRAAADRS